MTAPTNPLLSFSQKRSLQTPAGSILIEGPVSPPFLQGLTMDPGLKSFRPPDRQLSALVEIASLPVGAVVAAHREETVVGYATFHPPDECERWGQAGLPYLLEMGGIEVTPSWRKGGVGKALLETGFANPALENFIVIVNEFYWHWDLSGSGLDVWSYREMLARVMSTVGLIRCDTDEPEIASHPANMLMVRVGSRVTAEQMETFEHLRYKDRWLF